MVTLDFIKHLLFNRGEGSSNLRNFRCIPHFSWGTAETSRWFQEDHPFLLRHFGSRSPFAWICFLFNFILSPMVG